MKYLDAAADISEDGVYRYSLSRRLSMGERFVLFVGLNPSTADGSQDDPTIRRCVGFARAWGFDWLLMGNIYAYRATKPKVMWAAAKQGAEEIYGPLNQDTLKWMVHKADLIVAAWGRARLDCYGASLAGWILSLEHTRCLGRNQDGSPKHPLFVHGTTPLERTI
jgi:hypothetical protein